MKSKLFLFPVVALAVAGCTTVHTAPDQDAVKYGYGWTESGKWKGCVGPSAIERHGWSGLGDKYYYPAGQRTFDFTGGPNADSPPLTAVSNNNIEVTFAGVTSFNLDVDCKVLTAFHEKIGLKYQAYMDSDGTLSDGWRRMLNLYVGQQLHRSLGTEAAGFGYEELYNNNGVKQKIEKDLSQVIADQVNTFSGGTYFQNFSLVLQKPEIPDANKAALAAKQVSIAQNDAQKAKNATIQTELNSIRALVKVLGPDGYILYKAIQDGRITVMPIPMGSPLALPVPTR